MESSPSSHERHRRIFASSFICPVFIFMKTAFSMAQSYSLSNRTIFDSYVSFIMQKVNQFCLPHFLLCRADILHLIGIHIRFLFTENVAHALKELCLNQTCEQCEVNEKFKSKCGKMLLWAENMNANVINVYNLIRCTLMLKWTNSKAFPFFLLRFLFCCVQSEWNMENFASIQRRY